MPLERHRARRYSFHASIELTDPHSETQTKEQTSDLSLFGCHVDTLKPLPAGTKVRIKISYRSENCCDALDKVVHSRQNSGIGIRFTKIEPNDQLVLDKWIAPAKRPVKTMLGRAMGCDWQQSVNSGCFLAFTAESSEFWLTAD
jgi:hypothetical protein